MLNRVDIYIILYNTREETSHNAHSTPIYYTIISYLAESPTL